MAHGVLPAADHLVSSVSFLVAGMMCTREVFRHQIQFLRSRKPELELIVPDVAGFDSIARLARRLLDELQGQLAVVGFSLGGYVALEMLRLAPERVNRLALIGSQGKRV